MTSDPKKPEEDGAVAEVPPAEFNTATGCVIDAASKTNLDGQRQQTRVVKEPMASAGIAAPPAPTAPGGSSGQIQNIAPFFGVESSAGGKVCKMSVFGPIGGYFGDVTAKNFIEKLDEEASSATDIEVEINSGGGSLFDSIAIYNALVRHPAKVTVRVVGVAASGAALISMAGTERRISENANFMIHGARGGIDGTAEEIESYLKLMKNANAGMAKTFAKRTSKPENELLNLLSGADQWYTSAEAQSFGFMTHIDDVSDAKPAIENNSEVTIQLEDWLTRIPEAEGHLQTLVAIANRDGDVCLSSHLPELMALKIGHCSNNPLDGRRKGQIVESLASAAGINMQQVNSLLRGQSTSPPLAWLHAFSQVHGMPSYEELKSACEQDGCDFSNQANANVAAASSVSQPGAAAQTAVSLTQGVNHMAATTVAQTNSPAPAAAAAPAAAPLAQAVPQPQVHALDYTAAAASYGLSVEQYQEIVARGAAGFSASAVQVPPQQAAGSLVANGQVIQPNLPAPVAPVAAAPVASPAPAAQYGDPAAEYAERLRVIQAVNKRCSDAGFPEIAPDAIDQGWPMVKVESEISIATSRRMANEAKAEMESLRRKQEEMESGFHGGQFAIHSHGSPEGINQDDALQAAFCLSMGITPEELTDPFSGMSPTERITVRMPSLKKFTDKDLENAYKNFDGIGLQQVFLHYNRAEGLDSSMTWRGDASLNASFSSVNIPKFLTEAINRSVVAGFRKATPMWPQFARARTVQDFKDNIFYRVYATGSWDQVRCGDTLKHGELGATEAYRLKAETVGQYFQICREHVVNNDVGTVAQIAEQMAHYGRMAPEFLAFERLNAKYFNTTQNFTWTFEAFEALWKCFCGKAATDSKDPLNKSACGHKLALDIDRAIVLVNKCRQVDMMKILGGTIEQVIGTPDATNLNPAKAIMQSPFASMVNVVASSHINNMNGIAILPSPSLAPAIEIAFLNGRQVPVIQRVEPEPNRLGFALRGFLDVGVASTNDQFSCTVDDLTLPIPATPGESGSPGKRSRRRRKSKQEALEGGQAESGVTEGDDTPASE